MNDKKYSAKRLFLHIILISTILFLRSASALQTKSDTSRVLHLKKIQEKIQIDGIIDPVWSIADSASDFIQLSPYYLKTPSRRTTAKVLTTDEALYCLMICYDDREHVQQFTGMLDDGNGDIVSIMLDTFGDKRTAYKFAVTSSGVRADCRLLDDARNRDYNWDGVWFAASKIYDYGFVIEMEIPYKSIQYDETLSEWGLDFDRWRPATMEDLYWCKYVENEGQRISKFGSLFFENFKPSIKGLNLEVYPVAITRGTLLHDNKYKIDPDAGIDIFYNPSQKFTFQLTGNPDFAQIEADPFNFNISRYETYFNERRPFFTQGNEVFMPAGKQRNTGFYAPLELFYSRRIGKKLADGQEVPLLAGTKAFGRIDDWEYGGFLAITDQVDYKNGNETFTEPHALFATARIKKQIFGNSSIGVLLVGKNTHDYTTGVIDVDGAFRSSDWQLAYQFARSYMDSTNVHQNLTGSYAGSIGFSTFKENWFAQLRSRYINENFDVQQFGFVPWKGTGELVFLGGPRWYYKEGIVSAFLVYVGGAFGYKKVESYTDHLGILGWNMQFRTNWGYEITLSYGNAKDGNIKYLGREYSLSTWFNISPKWNANIFTDYSHTYNFYRKYLADYWTTGGQISWSVFDVLSIGTSMNMYIEYNPDKIVEDIWYNTRPYFSLTPVNDLNIRMYFDNVFVRSSNRFEQFIIGFLFSYNFSPKSWIYFAINEIRDRSDEFDNQGSLLPNQMHVIERVGVLKLKYLYYF